MTMPPPPVGAAPVPVSAIVAVPPLLVTVSVALFAPAVVGRNVTVAVVDDPAATVVVAGAPAWNCDGSVPAMTNGTFRTSGAGPVFVSVSAADRDPPSGTELNAIAV